MKRTIQVLGLTALAIGVGVGVVFALVDWHPDGVGTDEGILMGPPEYVTEFILPVPNAISFAGDGAVVAAGDLDATAHGGTGALSVTEAESLIAGLDQDAEARAEVQGDPVARMAFLGTAEDEGEFLAETWAGFVALDLVDDGEGGLVTLTADISSWSQATLEGDAATLSNDAGAAVHMDADGNVELRSGPDGNVIVTLEMPSGEGEGDSLMMGGQESSICTEEAASAMPASPSSAEQAADALERLDPLIAPMRARQ